jgi:transposase, IS5 family
VTTDRGYGQPAVERDLHDLGVPAVAILRQVKTSAARKTIEHCCRFHRLVKWRTECEGRISYLKRGYGWDRTRLHSAAIWCGHGSSPTSRPWLGNPSRSWLPTQISILSRGLSGRSN